VSTTAPAQWTEHVLSTLDRAGHRSTGPRTAVVGAIADLGCSTTAREIADLLRGRNAGVGMASVYRALELLERLKVVRRVDVGEGSARYEPAYPSGEHHHHLVCDACGNVTAFEDDDLERVIHALSRRVDFDIAGHEVTLRGACPLCSPSR